MNDDRLYSIPMMTVGPIGNRLEGGDALNHLVLERAAITAGYKSQMFGLRKVPFQMSKVRVVAKAQLV